MSLSASFVLIGAARKVSVRPSSVVQVWSSKPSQNSSESDQAGHVSSTVEMTTSLPPEA
ncbi:hypothetical protein D3C80_2161290 [compost metagenome]